MIAPAYFLENVSKLQHLKGDQIEPGCLTLLRRQRWEFGADKVAWKNQGLQRREVDKKKMPKICRVL